MMDFFAKLFHTDGFLARWNAGTSWESFPGLGWMHIISDLGIFGAFLAISGVLAWFVHRRNDVLFPRIVWFFCGFIFLCGLVHLVEISLFWFPVYRFSALLKLVTAFVSWVSLLVLIPSLPQALLLRSPAQLQEEIMQRTQELRDSEARLRAIFESTGNGILTLDDQWNILTANPACEHLFGLRIKEMLGCSFSDFMVALEKPWESEMGTGEGKIFGEGGDVVGRRKDGTTFPASLSMSKVILGQGRIYTAIVHDLSKFKKTEEALRQSENHLRLMLSQVPAILCTTDRKLHVTLFTSSASTGLSGSGPYSRKFIGDSLLEPEDEDLEFLPVKSFQSALKGNPVATEVKWDDRVFQFHIQSLLDLNNHVLGTIGIGLDVTEHKRTEAALRRSEAKLRALVQAANDGIITVTEKGVVQSVNPAGEKLFRYSAEELIGKNITLLLPSPHQDAHDQYFLNYLQTGRKTSIGAGREVAGRRKDGSTFPMYLSVGEVRSKRHRLFIGIVHDMTERKRSEQSLKFYAQELQQRNNELLRSNQELDEFAYVASHDLKEPLRGISNYSAFLLQDYGDKLDQDGKAKLERLQYLTSHMTKLIDSLLEFSRVGRLDLAVKATDLNRVLGDVLDSLRFNLQESRVEVRIPKPLSTILCDQVRIAEVFRNLITNAMKYNDKESKWIEIGETNKMALPPETFKDLKDEGIGQRIFYVRDNGIGIPKKHWGSIFRIFKRLHARDKFGGGTGAGLTIVKKIIERHGGQIFLDSNPAEGTTFFFTIPEMGKKSSSEENGTEP